MNAVVILIITFILFRVLLAIFLRNFRLESKKTPTHLDDLIVSTLEKGGPAISLIVALSLSLRFLQFTPFVYQIFHDLLLALVIIVCVLTLQRVLQHFLRRLFLHRGEGIQDFSEITETFLRFALWILALLLILSNLGINVTSLIAGLGIGGIAIALALQNILGDILSAFSIYFDKPFRIGDFIVVGPHSGTVKRIGIKSTRIESLQGEEIIIPNRELTNSRVQNFKRMNRRRVESTFKIDSEASIDQVRLVPSLVQNIFANETRMALERVSLKEISRAGLTFEMVYVIKDTHYGHFMEIQHALNVALLEVLRRENINLA